MEEATPEPDKLTDKLNFEDAMTRLGNLVASLEGGELGLEASIEAYEEGLRLAKACIHRLDKAELRIQQLSEASLDPLSDGQELIDN